MEPPRSKFTRPCATSMATFYPTRPSGMSFASRTVWFGVLTSDRSDTPAVVPAHMRNCASGAGTTGGYPLLRNFAKGLADRQHRVPDQARGLRCCLAGLHRFPWSRIADHL